MEAEQAQIGAPGVVVGDDEPGGTERTAQERGQTQRDHTESARIAAGARYEPLDLDGAFDRIAAMAARLLQAPMATVSIVGAERISFKATHGLHGVTQVDREPGLCSSAILQDEPYVVTDAAIDPRTAGNALVHGATGVRFYAAAPIITPDGLRLGTVNVLDTHPSQAGADELATLTDLAAVVMDELELHRSALTTRRQEHQLRVRTETLASTLQRSLLPPSLPTVPGLEVASHYHAASKAQVLGDFYDVIALGDGRSAFFLGDVTGHGAAAATVTSQVRYTLRTAALHQHDPAAALEELNTALLLDPNVPQHCTVMFGILQPTPTGGFDITLAGGGHPPALRTHADTGVVEEICPPGGMLVGALPDAEFATCSLHLRAGQTLLLYTDGIIEARPSGEFFGEEGLKTFLRARPGASAHQLVRELTALIENFQPTPSDDVALLALNVSAEVGNH